MIAVVSIETLLLAVLLVLVAGLLRSHAEILRRLGAGVEEPPWNGSRSPARVGAAAPAIAGTTPHGDALSLAFGGAGSVPTLLAFLTSGCATCVAFWETLGEPRLPAGVQTVIVAKGAEREQPARLRKLAPAGIQVVMSTKAWEDYAVPGAPYFVLVDGGVRGEGLATSWPALASLVSDAIADQRTAPGTRGPERAGSVEERLAAAGIAADDPSLYPGQAVAGTRVVGRPGTMSDSVPGP